MVKEIRIAARRPGLHEVTGEIEEVVAAAGVAEGLCTIFVRHTSASLTIQENADPSARRDLERWLERLVPEDDALYTHTTEGPDDMPAHIRAALTATSLSIPIAGGRLALGTWQGIFLWEHRHRGGTRRLAIHVGDQSSSVEARARRYPGAVEIRGERVVLRPWREGDEDALVRHADSSAVWRNLTDRFPHPYTLENARWWLDFNRELGRPAPHLAVVYQGEAIGGVGAERKADLARLTAEVGYWLGERFWGRGLATEALRLATRYAFERFDFERLEAHVLAWNPASCRVLEKAGYTLEGRQRKGSFKDGELVDTWLYARLRAD